MKPRNISSEENAGAFEYGLIDGSLDPFMAWLDAQPAASLEEFAWPEGPLGRENAKAQST